MLGFQNLKKLVKPLVGKEDAIKKFPISQNNSDFHSILALISHSVKLVRNLSLLCSIFRRLLKKQSVYYCDESHSFAFENLKAENKILLRTAISILRKNEIEDRRLP